MNHSLKLSFKSLKDRIEDAGRRAAQFLSHQGLSEDSVRVQMEILRELIANARSLDSGRSSGRSLSLKMQVDESAVTTEVSISVDESDRQRIEELEKTIQLLRGSQSPIEAYIAKCREPAERAECTEPVGMGLARIAYEDQALVDFFIDEERALTLSAVGRYQRKKRGANPSRRASSESASGHAY